VYDSKRPNPPRHGPASKAPAREERCDVGPEDLVHLERIHQILRLLNEPRQSAAPLAELVDKVPVLGARLRRAYRPPQWYSEDAYGPPSLTTVLVMVGNRTFEEILLEYLEDLTEFRASLNE
jgi:hypothetical protein